MPYLTQTDLLTVIPADFIIQALDDDADGIADDGVWDEVASAVGVAIDAFLGRRYPVPISVVPIPAIIQESARVLAAEMLYQRRGMHGDKNPFTKRADAWRKTLESIAAGEQQLTALSTPARPSISIISEPAGTQPKGRLNA